MQLCLSPRIKMQKQRNRKAFRQRAKPGRQNGAKPLHFRIFQGAELSGILYNERNPAARYKMCGSHQADRRRARLLRCLRE